MTRNIGMVKWFNNKAGYGFITVTDGSRSGTDVFIHHSAINVESQQYKYLVQGEYVDFELSKSEKSEHEYHAVNISGVKGGSLMCETRRITQEKRPYKPRVYKTPDDGVAVRPPRKSKSESEPKSSSESDGFTKVSRRSKANAKPSSAENA
jgi:CspA family cold shock protein